MKLKKLLEKIESIDGIDKAFIYDKQRKTTTVKNQKYTINSHGFSFDVYMSSQNYSNGKNHAIERARNRGNATFADFVKPSQSNKIQKEKLINILKSGIDKITVRANTQEDIIGAYAIYSQSASGLLPVIIGKHEKDLTGDKLRDRKLVAHIKTFMIPPFELSDFDNEQDFEEELSYYLKDFSVKTGNAYSRELPTDWYIVESLADYKLKLIKIT